MNMEKKKKTRPDAVTASAFLTIAAIMILCIVFYKITGAEGAGYMSAPIALFLFGYGALIASFETVTKDMIKNHLYRGMMNDAIKNLKHIMLVSFLTGLVLAILCAAFSGIFSNYVFHSTRSFYVLFMIVPMLLFLSIQGVLRGYLAGSGFSSVSLFSNLILVVMSFILSIIFSNLAYNHGTKVNALMHVDDIAAVYGAIGAALGISVSCLLSLIFILIMYLVHRGEIKAQIEKSAPSKNARSWHFTFDFIPICLLFGQFGFLLFLDECVYLAMAGRLHANQNNIESWGVYLGQCVALSVMIIALTALPFVKSWFGVHFFMVKRDFKQVRAKINSLIHFEAMLVFPIAVWIMILAGTMTNVIFGKTNDAAVNMIVLTIPVIVPGAMLAFEMFILEKLKNNLLIAANAVMGLIVHVLVLLLTTTIGSLGIHASMAAFLAGTVVIAVLGAVELKFMLDLKPEILRCIVKPLVAAAVSGIICLLADRVFVNLIGEILTLLISLILSYLVYMILLIVLRSVDRYDVERMPFGDQFAILVDKLEKR